MEFVQQLSQDGDRARTCYSLVYLFFLILLKASESLSRHIISLKSSSADNPLQISQLTLISLIESYHHRVSLSSAKVSLKSLSADVCHLQCSLQVRLSAGVFAISQLVYHTLLTWLMYHTSFTAVVSLSPTADVSHRDIHLNIYLTKVSLRASLSPHVSPSCSL